MITEKKKAFTLAEVLIALIVIGVVAAITVPMLHNDTADKKWNVARQKAQATIGEAFRLMTVNGEIDTKLSTAEFAEKIIPRYLKLEKTCKPDDYKQCGFSSKIKDFQGKEVSLDPKDFKWSNLSTSVNHIWNGSEYVNCTQVSEFKNSNYFFRTLDGFSVSFFYNPLCAIDKNTDEAKRALGIT